MNKLPVFRTFGRALGFTLWNCFTLFRLSWFPFSLLLAANFAAGIFAQRLIFHDSRQSIALNGDRPTVDPITISHFVENVVFINVLMMVLEAIVIAAVAVSIHRVILFNDRKPGVWFNFPFGGTEFRYVLMGVVSFFVIAAAIAAVMAPALYLVSGGDFAGFFSKMSAPAAPGAKGSPSPEFFELMAAYAVAWVFAIYFALRLMVWPPAIVATRRFALGEAWSLSRGNVWRLFGLCALVFFVFYFWIVGLAGAAYWYYTTKMKPESVDEKQITETVTEVPAAPSTAPPAPTPTPEDRAASLRTKSPDAPQGAKPDESPTPSQATPPAAPAGSTPGSPPGASALDDEHDAAMTAKEQERLKVWENLMVPYQSFVPLLWLIELIFYVLATGFGVALLSYSYKALKGYEIYEPIPEDA